MTKRFKIGLAVAASLLAILAITAAFPLADVSARAGQYRGGQTGDVLIGDRVVMSFRTAAGGRTPFERAEVAADRLAAIPEEHAAAERVVIRRVGPDQAIYIGDRLVTSISRAEAKAHGTDAATLAAVWRDSTIRALGGEPVSAVPAPAADQGSSYRDWVGAKQKWVPILSVANNGVRIGAAQIAGPGGQVDQVKAVAQLQLEFRGFARIYAYIPVSSLSVTRLERVQGVSVWATGDLKIVGF